MVVGENLSGKFQVKSFFNQGFLSQVIVFVKAFSVKAFFFKAYSSISLDR